MNFVSTLLFCGLLWNCVDLNQAGLRSLKTFQVYACDEDELRIDCPAHTLINIIYAQYGRPAGLQAYCDGQQSASTVNKEGCNSDIAAKTIKKLCNEKRICRLMTVPSVFQDDPCPKIKKYAEVAYKCNPEAFNSSTINKGQVMSIHCPYSQVILVSEVHLGTSEGEMAIKEECTSNHALKTTASDCTGQQQCVLRVDYDNTGMPECHSIQQIKISYACVPAEILRPESTKLHQQENSVIHAAWMGTEDRDVFSSYIVPRSPIENSHIPLEMQQDADKKSSNVTNVYDEKFVGFLRGWLAADKYVRGNRQKLIIYLSLSLSVGFLFFVVVVVLHHCLKDWPNKGEKLDVLPPPIIEDFFTESDLENFEGDEIIPMDTMTRKISEAIPRTPISGDSDTDHFFS